MKRKVSNMDGNDESRVTRARSLRMSTDTTTERESPRTLRKTRLSSVTSELRTPIRTTRLSVARGETPEPEATMHSLSVKRVTRSSSKSVRKEQTLKKETNKVLPASKVELEVFQESKETDDVANTSNRTPVDNKSERPSSVGPITRSMSKTPPFGDSTQNNTTPPQSNINKILKTYRMREMSTPTSIPTVEQHTHTQTRNKNASAMNPQVKVIDQLSTSSAENTNGDHNNSTSNDKLIVANKAHLNLNQLVELSSIIQESFNSTDLVISPLVKDVVIQIKPESLSSSTEKSRSNDKIYQSTVAKNDSNVTTTQLEETSTIIVKSQSSINELRQSIVGSDTNKIDEDGSMEQRKDSFFNAFKIQIDENKEIDKGDESSNDGPALTIQSDESNPDVKQLSMSRTQRSYGTKKTVVNYDSDELFNPSFPKHPSINLHCINADVTAQTPIDSQTLHRRMSSTPLADATSVSGQPPTQIDSIKSLADLEIKTVEVKRKKEMVARRLVSEDEEQNGESEFDQPDCEFIDTETVTVDNYQSGDSMDMFERNEIEENEIHEAGVSLGSQDTTESSEENDDEKLSCIVSDDEEIEMLLCSSDENSSISDVKNCRKRKSITIHDTTDDEDVDNKQIEVNQEQIVNAKEDNVCEVEVFSSSSENQQVSSVEFIPPIFNGFDSNDKPTKKLDEVAKENFKNTKLSYKKSNSNPCENVNLESVFTERFFIHDDLVKSTSTSDLSPKYEDSVHDEEKTKSFPVPYNISSTCKEQDKSNSMVLLTKSTTAVEKINSLQETVKEKSVFDNKQTRKEKTLVDELASGDSHLNQMFTDREISRHVSKTKLKRRSEVINRDMRPSQSFIEPGAEHKRTQPKHIRLYESLSGAFAELNASDQVQLKKAKKVTDEPSTNDSVSTNVQSNQPKSRVFYMKYCDEIIKATNEAKLQQKKVRFVDRKSSKEQPSAAVTIQASLPKVDDMPEKLKKNLMRLNSTKQTVKHAVRPLQPDPVSRLLSRKLSPHPEIANNGKLKRSPKFKIKHVSSVKISDEENQRVVDERFKNAAGFVKVSHEKYPRKGKTFKIRSGICKMEPCTPKGKDIRKVPSIPQDLSGFKELASSPKASKYNKVVAAKQRKEQTLNWATESALRFKRQIFGRGAK